MKVLSSVFFLSYLANICEVVAEGDSHDSHEGHGHGAHAATHAWEYAGVFSFEAGEAYMVTLAKSGDKYADKTMKTVFMACPDSADHADECLEAEESHIAELFAEVEDGDLTPTPVAALGDIAPSETAMYLLTPNAEWPLTSYLLAPDQTKQYIIAFEHSPLEFEPEGARHWLLDHHGDEIEADYEEGGHDDHSDELSSSTIWMYSIIGTLIGCASSALGALLVLLGMKAAAGSEIALERTSKLASGAVIGVVTMHLIGESGELANGWSHNWELGLALTLGVCIPFLIDAIMAFFEPAGGDMEKTVDTPDDKNVELANTKPLSSEGNVETGATPTSDAGVELEPMPRSMAWSSLLGDGFHNFFDGVLIASAFNSCPELGWTVSVAVMIHELPQEMADFLILRRSGWSVCWAFSANVGVSLTAILGVVLFLSLSDSFSFKSQGLLLAFSSGVFLTIGFELFGNVGHSHGGSAKAAHSHAAGEKFLQLFLWLVGAGIIFVLMLWHPECHSDSSHGDHSGHGH